LKQKGPENSRRKGTMKKNTIFICVICTSIFLSVSACKANSLSSKSTLAPQSSAIADGKSVLSVDEQQKKALELFHNIYETSQKIARPAGLGQLVDMYHELINTCPDTPLAQECYKLLIMMYLYDFNPPKQKEAIGAYKTYAARYPESPLRPAILNSMARFLFESKNWQDLSDLMSPLVKTKDVPGQRQKPFLLFLYAEANYNLKNFQEATWGYQEIVTSFPASRFAKRAESRIAETKSR